MKTRDLITSQGLMRFIPQKMDTHPKRRKHINTPEETNKPTKKKK